MVKLLDKSLDSVCQTQRPTLKVVFVSSMQQDQQFIQLLILSMSCVGIKCRFPHVIFDRNFRYLELPEMDLNTTSAKFASPVSGRWAFESVQVETSCLDVFVIFIDKLSIAI